MRSPIGFTKLPVTIVICAVYIGLFVGLLYVHHVVPGPPKAESPTLGINITEAWRDLQELTRGFHPYNSHRNDEVRDWLLHRIDAILLGNNVKYDIEQGYESSLSTTSDAYAKDAAPVVVFNDMLSNSTATADSTLSAPLSVYFEGTNIIVYVRGTEESNETWWRDENPEPPSQKRAVLVNAHYDSVSTGYGATDDGVGVVSILQLIKYFTTQGNQPKRGLVALLNNGEEDYLNGARAFLQHPISRLTDSFLNLEGAGAGGRAALFRTTDAEVTKYYKTVPYPFGSVVSADAFKRGVIRSQTDYVIFNGDAGMRGLDVAFMEPRARYHTSQDSAKDTSRASLWHMLSAAIATTKAMTADIQTDLHPDTGSDSVWFDVFGMGFGLMQLKAMFALSVSLLVACPIVLILLLAILGRADKRYLFSANYVTDPLDPHTPDEATIIGLGGWKGLTRFPIAFILATAATVSMALGIAKVNPYIVYSSPYAIWSMMLSAWFCVAWFFLRGASFMRPSALQRAHTLGWLFFLFWVALVATTVSENNFGMSSGYFIVIYAASSFAALAVSYLELFALPKKSKHVRSLLPAPQYSDESIVGHRPRSRGRRGGPSSITAISSEPEDASETTSLLSNRPKRRIIGTHSATDDEYRGEEGVPKTQNNVFGEEQAWSEKLPTFLWIVEFLLLAPAPVILVGQIGLLLTSSLSQTLADGNSALTVYLCISGLVVLLLLPTSPFLHRFNRRVPLFLLLICIGTLIYNLVAFPFSEQNRLKVFFLQQIDVESGLNKVSLVGLPDYIEDIIKELPSSQGKAIHCKDPGISSRNGLLSCTWDGIAPDLVTSRDATIQPAKRMAFPPMIGLVDSKSSKLLISSSAFSSNPTKKKHTASFSSTPLGKPLKSTASSATISLTSFTTSTTASKSTTSPPGPSKSSSSSSSSYATSSVAAPSPPAQPFPSDLPPPLRFANYISLSANRTSKTSATISISGRNTRACKLLFASPIHAFSVRGAAVPTNAVPYEGTGEIRLWSREWEREWVVDVEWDSQRWNVTADGVERGLDGTAVCMWSEQNPAGTIPALDEVRMFAPNWVAVSKLSDGLVEGLKHFVV